ncbi:pyruvate dehydrogenase (acetyl-transferring) E1 component subunit alpha, partial [Pseudomonas sp. BGM005]|nr:pyruvate dehydrogenase (acetyl-transferring) E1 component subunit alpha [Pseudomonas sp. BG5]
DEHVADTQAAADAIAKEMRAQCLGMVTRPPLAVFDGVYAEPHSGLERQRSEYAAYLASFDGAV